MPFIFTHTSHGDRVAQVAACKTAYAGSIPARASISGKSPPDGGKAVLKTAGDVMNPWGSIPPASANFQSPGSSVVERRVEGARVVRSIRTLGTTFLRSLARAVRDLVVNQRFALCGNAGSKALRVPTSNHSPAKRSRLASRSETIPHAPPFYFRVRGSCWLWSGSL